MEVVRAEHASLTRFLERTLNDHERERVFLPTFSQWSFSLAALTEVAVALRELHTDVVLGFWGGSTLLPDVGWSSPRWVARITGTRTRDDWTQVALRRNGFRDEAFADPPIRDWAPRGQIPTDPGNTRSEIRRLTYRGSPMGRAILQLRPDHAVPVTDAYAWPRPWLEASIRSYAYVFDQVDALIEQRGLTAVIVSNGRFLHDRAAAEAALVEESSSSTTTMAVPTRLST